MRGNTVKITRQAIEDIIGHSLLAYPSECCGLIFTGRPAGGEILIDASAEMEKGENTADHYAMDPFELVEKEDLYRHMGYEVAGFYHSHPDKRDVPSKEDEELMIPGMIYLIVSIIHGRYFGFSAWTKERACDAALKLRLKETEE
ncbi:MAG: M67 family metallopeptidase [Lachnospiraceae bacterium]|nr:M67 family metallopeptidase [Lachnospiraceae bacterium]